MKIKTEENGIPRLYVQRLDLAILPSLLEDGDPAVIYWIGLEYLHTNTTDNDQEFVLVENEQLIRFIERATYIFDYYDFMNYSVEQLKEKVNLLKAVSRTISNVRVTNQNKYMQLTLLNLIEAKMTKQYVPIPVSYWIENQKTS